MQDTAENRSYILFSKFHFANSMLGFFKPDRRESNL